MPLFPRVSVHISELAVVRDQKETRVFYLILYFGLASVGGSI